MGICWYCYWGWSKPVVEVYRAAVKMLESVGACSDSLEYGPSHVVWSDENWGDSTIAFCLKQCDEPDFKYDEMTPEILKIIRWSLEMLLKIPIEIRDPEPADYDDENPAMYPPLIPVEKKWSAEFN